MFHYLNEGTGEACAGHVKLIAELNDRCNCDPLVSPENLGAVPPIGFNNVMVTSYYKP